MWFTAIAYEMRIALRAKIQISFMPPCFPPLIRVLYIFFLPLAFLLWLNRTPGHFSNLREGLGYNHRIAVVATLRLRSSWHRHELQLSAKLFSLRTAARLRTAA
jgi:hypothetical protein